MQYTTKTLEKALAFQREREEKYHHRDFFVQLATERLTEAVATRADNELAHQLHFLGGSYADKADSLLALEKNMPEAKRYYHLAARAHALCYALRRAGFHWYVGNAVGPYNFKKNNFNFSKNAILANAPELALSIAGEDTIEGMLVMGNYDLARQSLPREPAGDELELCMWGIANGDQKVLDQGLQERIKTLRRQGRSCSTILDSWGLAAVQLARHRGMTCGVEVAELPWQLLDDTPADTTGPELPMEAEIRAIIAEKEKTP